jgi:hypothetical protein
MQQVADSRATWFVNIYCGMSCCRTGVVLWYNSLG